MKRQPPAEWQFPNIICKKIIAIPGWQRWPGEEDPAAAITPGMVTVAMPDKEVVAAEEAVPD